MTPKKRAGRNQRVHPRALHVNMETLIPRSDLPRSRPNSRLKGQLLPIYDGLLDVYSFLVSPQLDRLVLIGVGAAFAVTRLTESPLTSLLAFINSFGHA